MHAQGGSTNTGMTARWHIGRSVRRVLRQGWLNKRPSGRMKVGAWQRRWFVLQSDGSLYHLSSRSGEDRKAVVNLRISTIKRSHAEKDGVTFSLVSPALTYFLQAESSEERQGWIDCIQVPPASLLPLCRLRSCCLE